jgi:hypothetical protein
VALGTHAQIIGACCVWENDSDIANVLTEHPHFRADGRRVTEDDDGGHAGLRGSKWSLPL